MPCQAASRMPGSKDSKGSLLSSGRQTLAYLASQLALFVALWWLDDTTLCGKIPPLDGFSSESAVLCMFHESSSGAAGGWCVTQ